MIELSVEKVRGMQRISSSQVEAGDCAVFKGEFVRKHFGGLQAFKITGIKRIFPTGEGLSCFMVSFTSGHSVVTSFPSAFEYYREEVKE